MNKPRVMHQKLLESKLDFLKSDFNLDAETKTIFKTYQLAAAAAALTGIDAINAFTAICQEIDAFSFNDYSGFQHLETNEAKEHAKQKEIKALQDKINLFIVQQYQGGIKVENQQIKEESETTTDLEQQIKEEKEKIEKLKEKIKIKKLQNELLELQTERQQLEQELEQLG